MYNSKKRLLVCLLVISFFSTRCQQGAEQSEYFDVSHKIQEKVCELIRMEKDVFMDLLDYDAYIVDVLREDPVLQTEFYEVTAYLEDQGIDKVAHRMIYHIKFLLLRECNAYRKVEQEFDQKYREIEPVRNAHLLNKKLVFDLFDNLEGEKVVALFDVSDMNQLRKDLKFIAQSYEQYKNHIYWYPVKLNRDQITFRNGFQDPMTSEEKAALTFIFDDLGEKVIEYYYIYEDKQVSQN